MTIFTEEKCISYFISTQRDVNLFCEKQCRMWLENGNFDKRLERKKTGLVTLYIFLFNWFQIKALLFLNRPVDKLHNTFFLPWMKITWKQNKKMMTSITKYFFQHSVKISRQIENSCFKTSPFHERKNPEGWKLEL